MTVWSYVWAPGLACLQAVSKYVCKLHIESHFRIKSLKCPKLKRFNFLLIADLYTDSLPHPWWWLSLAHLATSVNTSLGQIHNICIYVCIFRYSKFHSKWFIQTATLVKGRASFGQGQTIYLCNEGFQQILGQTQVRRSLMGTCPTCNLSHLNAKNFMFCYLLLFQETLDNPPLSLEYFRFSP